MNAVPINPNGAEFADFAAGRRVAPLVFRAPNDGMMAWTAFAALESRHPFAFFLESADPGENGRYSFMGIAPRRLFRFAAGVFSELDGGGAVLAEHPCADPVAAMQERMAPLFSPPPEDGELPPFLGGIVGYAGYDCVRCFELVGAEKPDLLNIPDMLWMQTDWLAVFDHFRRAVYAVKSCYA
ncbi:MAG: hypothetical protein HAW59_02645, partial [Betaproteobacteria bacterium]|nr:hypothetical protein [Betaproteobacteria bacterium]